MKDSIRKVGAISLLISTISFLAFSTICMYLYPGGYEVLGITIPTTHYRFSKNFFSDLGVITTPTGMSNIPSFVLFCIGMVLVGISFIIHAIPLVSYFSSFTKQETYAVAAFVLAIISSFGFIGVGFTPWEILPTLHHILVIMGFGTSALYCLFFGFAVFKEKSYPNFYGILAISYFAAIVAYALIEIVGPPYHTFAGRTFHVLAQKIVGYLIMVLLSIQAIGSLLRSKKKR